MIFEGLGRAGSYESAVNVYPCSFILVVGQALEVNPAGDNGPWSQVCR